MKLVTAFLTLSAVVYVAAVPTERRQASAEVCWTPGDPCYKGWVYHGGSCYLFATGWVSWHEAQEACKSYGSKLAEVETQAENEFFMSTARAKNVHAYWIGGTDETQEGKWVWASDGRPLSPFSAWGTGEPNDAGGNEDCLMLRSEQGLGWNDFICSWPGYYICEAPPLSSVGYVRR